MAWPVRSGQPRRGEATATRGTPPVSHAPPPPPNHPPLPSGMMRCCNVALPLPFPSRAATAAGPKLPLLITPKGKHLGGAVGTDAGGDDGGGDVGGGRHVLADAQHLASQAPAASTGTPPRTHEHVSLLPRAHPSRPALHTTSARAQSSRPEKPLLPARSVRSSQSCPPAASSVAMH
jgi:hypothetical protein